MIARLPHPHALLIMAAAAVTSDGDLGQRAQPSTVQSAAGLRLYPRGVVEATTHSAVRAAAHSIRRVELPAQLDAAELRVLEEGYRWR